MYIYIYICIYTHHDTNDSRLRKSPAILRKTSTKTAQENLKLLETRKHMCECVLQMCSSSGAGGSVTADIYIYIYIYTYIYTAQENRKNRKVCRFSHKNFHKNHTTTAILRDSSTKLQQKPENLNRYYYNSYYLQ